MLNIVYKGQQIILTPQELELIKAYIRGLIENRK